MAVVLGVPAPAWAMQIAIRFPDSTTIALDVEPSDTIDNVKAKIQDRTTISPERQVLVFGDDLLEDGRTLSDYSVQRNNTLDLINTVWIEAPDGDAFLLVVPITSTPADVAQRIADRTGIPVDEQQLAYDGVDIAEDQTLGDAGVPVGGALALSLRPSPSPSPSSSPSQSPTPTLTPTPSSTSSPSATPTPTTTRSPNPNTRAPKWRPIPSSVGSLSRFRPVADWGRPTAELSVAPARTCLLVGVSVVTRYSGRCRMSLTQPLTAATQATRTFRVRPGSDVGAALPTRTVPFGPDSAKVKSPAKARLRQLAQRLRQARIVLVSGHAARSPESAADARELSQSRARAVAKILRAQGVQVDAVAGYGHRQVKQTAAGSRRAEVSWLP